MEALRPMSTGELLDRTISVYRRNFTLFLGISVVTHAIYLGYQLLTMRSTPAVRGGARIGLSYYSTFLIGWVFLSFVLKISEAATVKAVAAVYLEQPSSIWAAYGALRKRIFSVLGILLFIWLLFGLLSALLILALVAIVAIFSVIWPGLPTSHVASLVLGISVLVGCFAAFVAVYVRYALAVQVCVVENLRFWASMKRSVFLSKGGRWRIASVYLVFFVLSVMATFTSAWLGRMGGRLLHGWTAQAILVYVSTFIAGSITAPFATISLSLLYYDERVRKEAFDLHWMLSTLQSPITPPFSEVQA